MKFGYSLDSNQVVEFLENQQTLLEAYTKAKPLEAVDLTKDLLTSLDQSIFKQIKDKLDDKFEPLVDSYEKIQKYLEKKHMKKNYAQNTSNEGRPYNRAAKYDDYEHEDNFRELSVVPTVEDILSGAPVVKRILVDRGFLDVDSYLDIHFRLLREDFICPLREGIQLYKSDNTFKNMDIRIYRNVKFAETVICLLYTSPSPRDKRQSRMPSSA